MNDTEVLAGKHLAIAVSLMGKEWVQAQLNSMPQTQQQGRGRKAGAVPEDDQRCSWTRDGARCVMGHAVRIPARANSCIAGFISRMSFI